MLKAKTKKAIKIMAVNQSAENKIKTVAGLTEALAYITNPAKIYEVSRINCSGSNSNTLEQFRLLRLAFNQNKGIIAHHFIQSFSPNDNITPETVHRFGVEYVKQCFPNYQVVVSTHIDKEHLHNHIIVNSCNMITGKKFYDNKESMKNNRDTPEPDRITEWFGDYAMYASKKLGREEIDDIFVAKFIPLLLNEWYIGFRGEKSIEKEFFEHTSRLNSECFKNSLPNNLDDWEKAIINELEGVSEQVASGNIPVLQERTKIYIDMDGTIARFHDENLYLERMFEKGFFRDLKPFENAVAAIEKLVNDSTAEIYILSATLNSCSLDEKNQWLDKYLPNIDKDHRIFTSLNVPKSEAIGHQLTDKDILIDDYNKNLLEWEKAGGTSVKAKNNINHKGLHGELWKGEIVDVVNGDIYSDICKLANENYYYAYISQSDVEQLKQSGICYHLRMSGERIIAKVNIIDKPILDNIVDNNRSVNCATGSTIKI